MLLLPLEGSSAISKSANSFLTAFAVVEQNHSNSNAINACECVGKAFESCLLTLVISHPWHTNAVSVRLIIRQQLRLQSAACFFKKSLFSRRLKMQSLSFAIISIYIRHRQDLATTFLVRRSIFCSILSMEKVTTFKFSHHLCFLTFTIIFDQFINTF